MYFIASIAAACFCLSIPAQPGDDTHGITLEQIMADPQWIGQFPERSYWADDSLGVLFYRNRVGEHTEDLVLLDIESQEEREVDTAERSSLARTSWVYNSARDRRLCVRSGDIFLHDIRSDTTTQLTRTGAREYSAAFLDDDSKLRYEVGGQWYIHDLKNASIRQVADVRFTDMPAGEEDDSEGFLDQQQERLFETITDRQQRVRDRKNLNRQIDEARESAVPGPFYLGKELQRRRWSLSRDGRYLAVVASEPSPDALQDQMPSYVTEDGYVSVSDVRIKVGVRESANERLFLIDTHAEEWNEVDLSVLPGISDDPLAFLRIETQEVDDTEEAEDIAEPSARGLSIRSLRWQPGGDSLVVQAWSHDHKDRWVFTVSPNDEAGADAVPIFRDSTEAWINRRVGTGNWTRSGDVYWFLSESSGYSHIYAWDGTHTKQVTMGDYEVWDVAESPEPNTLYCRTNQPDASIYEVAKVGLASESFEVVTGFGHVVERFELSPDGTKVLMEVSSNDSPAEIYIQDIETGEEAVQLTDSISEQYDRLPWIKPEYVDVPCRDGRTIRARVYSFEHEPNLALKPGVIFVHGAGYTQNIDRGWPYYFREMMFHSMLAYEGYVVVDIDFRASAGYGRDFRTAIYRNMGGPEIDDMVDTAAWMVEELGVRTGVGTYGGSYGGFLAIMAVFKEPEVFRAAAAIRPVTDWAHYNHGYTSPILNTPDLDPDAYERSSPIEHAEGFEGGLLICHGMLDDNVLVQDTIRLQQRLIELEKQDWEVALYPLESHAFIEPSAWLDEYRRVFKLFERRLNAVNE